MRKFLGVSFAAILAVAPMVARADDPTTPIAPVTIAANETVGVASTKYVKEAYNAMAGKVNAELAKKQDVIDATHKLDADSVNDTTSTHKFVTAADKTKWDGKQNALSEAQMNAVNSGITSAKVTTYDGYANGKANVDLDNLSTTGKANVSAQGTYNASTNYVSGTVGAAIKGKQDTLSEAQLAAANSGITSAKVSTYDAFATGKQDKLTEGDGIDITNNTIKVDLSANSGLAFDATDKTLELSSATKTSLGKADNAVRMVKVNGTALEEGATDGDVNITVATGTGNGTIKVNGADVSVKGLGSAAYTESTAYATSAQGTKADNAALAIGTGTLNTTATTLIGAVNEVNGKVLTIYSGWNNGGTPGTTSTVTLTTPAS